MAQSSRTKNFRHGTIKLSDGTGTPLEVTVQYENGDFSADGFKEGQKDVVAYLDRGVLYDLQYTNQTFPTFSFSAHFTDLSDATDKLLYDACMKTGAFASAVSTRGANQVYTLDLLWTIEGTDLGDSADHTLALDDCRIDNVQLSEGDPSAFTISGTVFGAITAT